MVKPLGRTRCKISFEYTAVEVLLSEEVLPPGDSYGSMSIKIVCLLNSELINRNLVFHINWFKIVLFLCNYTNVMPYTAKTKNLKISNNF